MNRMSCMFLLSLPLSPMGGELAMFFAKHFPKSQREILHYIQDDRRDIWDRHIIQLVPKLTNNLNMRGF